MSLLQHESYSYDDLFSRLSPILFCEPLEVKDYVSFNLCTQKSWHSAQYLVENFIFINLYICVTITTINIQIISITSEVSL